MMAGSGSEKLLAPPVAKGALRAAWAGIRKFHKYGPALWQEKLRLLAKEQHAADRGREIVGQRTDLLQQLVLGQDGMARVALLALLQVVDDHVLVEVFACSAEHCLGFEVARRAGGQQAVELGAVGLGILGALAHEDAAVVERMHLAATIDAQQHDGAAGHLLLLPLRGHGRAAEALGRHHRIGRLFRRKDRAQPAVGADAQTDGAALAVGKRHQRLGDLLGVGVRHKRPLRARLLV